MIAEEYKRRGYGKTGEIHFNELSPMGKSIYSCISSKIYCIIGNGQNEISKIDLANLIDNYIKKNYETKTNG